MDNTHAVNLKPSPLLTETEAAELLGCSVQTLRNYRWKRQAPIFKKIGPRMVRYRVSDLEAFINGADKAGAE